MILKHALVEEDYGEGILTEADQAYIEIMNTITDILMQLPNGQIFDRIRTKILFINELLEKYLMPVGFMDRLHKWEDILEAESTK